MNHRDVRVFDERGGPRFLQHPLAAQPIVDEILRQHLERDVAAEVQVARPIHDAHAAAADLFDDLVVRQRPADHFSI